MLTGVTGQPWLPQVPTGAAARLPHLLVDGLQNLDNTGTNIRNRFALLAGPRSSVL